MKRRKSIFYIGVIFALLIVGCQTEDNLNTTQLKEAKLYGDEIINTPYGDIELQHNYITDEGSQKLFDAMDLQRSSQAYIWSTPLVSMTTWQIEQDKNYETGKLGEFGVFLSLKEKRGVVTGNLTTPYILQFYNLSKGALVI